MSMQLSYYLAIMLLQKPRNVKQILYWPYEYLFGIKAVVNGDIVYDLKYSTTEIPARAASDNPNNDSRR